MNRVLAATAGLLFALSLTPTALAQENSTDEDSGSVGVIVEIQPSSKPGPKPGGETDPKTTPPKKEIANTGSGEIWLMLSGSLGALTIGAALASKRKRMQSK